MPLAATHEVEAQVKIKRGTMTMMSPSMKTALIAEWLQLGFVGMQEAKAVVSAYISRDTGMQDDPHRMRVRRQVAYWNDGPPQGWMPPQPQMDPQTQQPMPPPNPGAGDPAQPLWRTTLSRTRRCALPASMNTPCCSPRLTTLL